jgi:hypothetical protein
VIPASTEDDQYAREDALSAQAPKIQTVELAVPPRQRANGACLLSIESNLIPGIYF